MKLLITGGCGFLGSNLAAESLRRGDELVVFDNLSRLGSTDNLVWLRSQGEFRHVHGDIRNANDVTRLIQEFQPDTIFHLAGQVAMTTSIANPRLDFEINAMGSHNLLEAVRQHAPEAAVIYSSTNKVYGDLEQYTYRETETRYECIEYPRGFDEKTPLEFHSPYGCSKGAADQYMLDYARIFGLKTVVFRHSSMYGGRQFATYDQGWVGWFCQKAIDIRNGTCVTPFTVAGNGKQVRDVLHGDDMVQLYFTAMSHIDIVKGLAFNIGGGIENSLSLLELFRMLESDLDCVMKFTQIPARQSDQKLFVADTSFAYEMLAWKPVITKTIGIRNSVAWIENKLVRK